MGYKLTFLSLLLAVCLISTSCQQSTDPAGDNIAAPASNTTLMKGGGFDEFGYNYSARIFNGIADGVDKNLDGKYWGDPTYANDKLVMKWNAEWDRGKAEKWLNPPYAAWENNEWNGNVSGGSGEVWHFKIIWVGKDLENSPNWKEGGYPAWDQFEVIMDHGTAANEHFWFAHANPTGYGN